MRTLFVVSALLFATPLACVALIGVDRVAYNAGDASLTVIYVSGSGDDASGGASASAPKRTIQSAINAVKAAGTKGAEIHVCTGSYDEPGLTLDYPVSLRGAYSCQTWDRLASYGYPDFDESHATLITSHDQEPALSIQSKDIDGAVTVDGLALTGGTGALGSVALIVSGASPMVSNCRINGGSGTSATQEGSTGVSLSGGAGPELFRDYIHGGSGTSSADTRSGGAAASGSIGVFGDATAGVPHVHECMIHAGSGTDSAKGGGSVGVALEGVGAVAGSPVTTIDGNMIDMGTGTSANASLGIIASGDRAYDILQNTIINGSGLGDKYGIIPSTTGNVRIIGNRVYGGDGSGALNVNAIFVNNSSSVVVVNNEVHAGNANHAMPAMAPVVRGIALINLAANATVLIAHNTVYAGHTAVNAASLLLTVSEAPTPSTIAIENNLLLGDLGPNDIGVYLDASTCTGVTHIQNNLFGGIPSGAAFLHCGAASYISLDALAGAPPSSANNRVLAGSCAADAGSCISVPGCSNDGGIADVCPTAMFGSWNLDGLASLPAGWKLAPTLPCAIATGGLDLTKASPAVTDDIFGAPRTRPVTFGAQELEPDAGCTP